MEVKCYVKRRISVFLCLLFILPAIMGALPQATIETQAAQRINLLINGFSSSKSTFEVKQKTAGFYLGDFVTADAYGNNGSFYKSYGYLSTNSGAAYKSSNPAVASINSKTGLVSAKKNGSTTITVKFKGASIQCTIKVVSRVGKLTGNTAAYQKASKALVKTYGKKITKSNRNRVVGALNLYLQERDKVTYSKGVLSQYNYQNGYSTTTIIAPECAHAYAIADCVSHYIEQTNPLGSGCAKMFKISKVTGKGSSVTVKLKRSVTDDDIFGITAAACRNNLGDSLPTSGSKVSYPVFIRDKKTGHKYYASATAIKGKNTISIRCQGLKLVKGKSYELVGAIYKYRRDGALDITLHEWVDLAKTTFKAQ